MREVEVEVARADWPAFLAALTAGSAGASVQVLADGAFDPDGPGRREWSLHRCAYDSDEEMLELALEHRGSGQPGLRCFVSRPCEILDRESPMERTVTIRDAAGESTVLRLRRRPPRRISFVAGTDLYGRRTVPLRARRPPAGHDGAGPHRAGGPR